MIRYDKLDLKPACQNNMIIQTALIVFNGEITLLFLLLSVIYIVHFVPGKVNFVSFILKKKILHPTPIADICF
jgi:hypothetical protein